MKNKLLIFSLILFSFSMVKAQEMWFDAGIKGSFGPTFLLNTNVLDDSGLDQKITNGYGVGGKFSFNFGYIHGITIDLMYSRGHQNYKSINTTTNTDVKWNNYDLYVLYRMYRTINYLELGPKFSKVNEFTNNDVVRTSYYNKSYPSAVLGFGWYVFGRKAFTGTLGFRFEYGFDDIISDSGKENGYPVNPYRTTGYTNYKTTNPLLAQVVFELNWGIGYFAKTACAERKHFFKFE